MLNLSLPDGELRAHAQHAALFSDVDQPVQAAGDDHGVSEVGVLDRVCEPTGGGVREAQVVVQGVKAIL